VGLATDYCVLSSAIDAVKFQLRTIIVQDGIRGVKKETVDKAHEEMADWGVEFVQSHKDLPALLT
jgi:nicotinamidase/pyrazinamidase